MMLQAGKNPNVVLEVEPDRKNIFTLANSGDWISVLEILDQDKDLAQLLEPMNSSKDTIVHLAASKGQTDVVSKLFQQINDNQELWCERQANIYGNNPLHLAAFNGHTNTCKCIAAIARDLANAKNKDGNTPLHLAAAEGYGETCKYYIYEMAPETAKDKNNDGNTPLHMAAAWGHTDACKCIAENEEARETAKATNKDGETPIFLAAFNGHKEVFDTLSKVPNDHEIAALARNNGDTILHCAISGEYFDLACNIINKYKGLIDKRNDMGFTPLHLLANNPSLFKSGCRLGVLDSIFYACTVVSTESESQNECTFNLAGKIFSCLGQNQCMQGAYNCMTRTLTCLISVIGILIFVIVFFGLLFAMLLVLCLIYIPAIFGFAWWRWFNEISEIKDKKLKHKWAEKVLKQLVHNIDDWEKFGKIESPFLIAGKKGVVEMVKEILGKFPIAILDMDFEDKNIMQLAAKHRQHGIYESVPEIIGDEKSVRSLLGKVDAKGNSVMHLAAEYPKGQSVLIPGAASQMYYEYRWFKFVKGYMPPQLSNRLNHKGQTAMEVFIETHQELAMERVKWLRNASQSCSVVAALITTVAFATISTVPGGLRQDNGSPVFQGGDIFNTFSISSFIAFCFSALSLIMFLGILFFPSHDLDFGNIRPSNLIWGINYLFVSIVAMFLSFFSGDLFVLDKKMKYLAYPTFAFTLCMAISRCPFYSEFASQAAFHSEFPITKAFSFSSIPKRARPDNLSF